jgi:hypothetical protein
MAGCNVAFNTILWSLWSVCLFLYAAEMYFIVMSGCILIYYEYSHFMSNEPEFKESLPMQNIVHYPLNESIAFETVISRRLV